MSKLPNDPDVKKLADQGVTAQQVIDELITIAFADSGQGITVPSKLKALTQLSKIMGLEKAATAKLPVAAAAEKKSSKTVSENEANRLYASMRGSPRLKAVPKLREPPL